MADTHCQPAQPSTLGKRATLWANELVMDLNEIDHRLATLKLRGVKGTTCTQASFMELFKGDADKIRAVDASIAEEMGFDSEAFIPVSGQTYSRKVDAFILNALAGIGQSCMKFATDLRLPVSYTHLLLDVDILVLLSAVGVQELAADVDDGLAVPHHVQALFLGDLCHATDLPMVISNEPEPLVGS